jgi:hypothetical protein
VKHRAEGRQDPRLEGIEGLLLETSVALVERAVLVQDLDES